MRRLFRSIVGTSLLVGGEALAVDRLPLSLREYHHTAWTESDGAPGNVWSITQTRDGFLWLGTPTGLYRFDGMTFSRHEVLPAGSSSARGISQVLVTDDDRVAVSFSTGGIHMVPVDRTEHCCKTEGIPDREALGEFATGPRGQLWQTTQDAVYELDGLRWTKVDLQSMGLPGSSLKQAMRGRDGSFLVNTGDALYRRAPDASEFMRLPLARGQEAVLATSVDGQARSFQPGRAWRSIVNDKALSRDEASVDRHQTSEGTLFGSDGSYWRSGASGGVQRTPRQPDANYAYKVVSGPLDDVMDTGRLSSPYVMCFYEDREGNMWAGTKGGIDRFRPQAVKQVAFPGPQVYFAVVPDTNRAMFVGTADGGGDDVGWRITDGTATRVIPGLAVTAAYRDRDGTILAGSEQGLFRISNTGTKTALAIPGRDANRKVQAMGRDGAGRLWVSFRGKPVEALVDGTWRGKGGLALPDIAPAHIAIDADGSAWFGYSTNRVDHIQGDRVTTYTEDQGIRLGTVTAILPGRPVLFGGDRGMAMLRDGHAVPIHASHPDALASVTGLVRQADRTVWINGLAGGVRISVDEMNALATDPEHVLQVRVFGPSDGMPGTAQQVRPLPTLAEGTDGVLYFSASEGLAYLDPYRVPAAPLAPRVHLNAIIDSAGSRAAGVDVSLPPDKRDLRIAYSAPTPSFPERVTYRYRLDGLDRAWHEVGDRREATYTNLPPGDYRFMVEAANEEGRWSGQPTTMRLHVAPKFTETWWFIFVCVLAALALLELAYMFRLRLAARSMEQRLRVRTMERESVARDLHDTLLQGIQGLLLRLQAWVKDDSFEGALRQEINEAVDLGRALLVEGRGRILSLRDPHQAPTHLHGAIRNACERADVPACVVLTSTASGQPLAATELAIQEATAIVSEAVCNAIRHAQPRRVDIRTAYSRKGVTVEIADDGAGICADILSRGGKDGHWGLPGMRERAARMGGELTVARGRQAGTLVSLRISRASLQRSEDKAE